MMNLPERVKARLTFNLTGRHLTRFEEFDNAIVKCVEMLAKIEDPKLMGHTEPDHYTQLSFIRSHAGEVLEELTKAIEGIKN